MLFAQAIVPQTRWLSNLIQWPNTVLDFNKDSDFINSFKSLALLEGSGRRRVVVEYAQEASFTQRASDK